MGVKFSNNAATLLTNSVTSSATSLVVDDVSEFPTVGGADYMYLTLSNLTNIEVIKVTAVAGSTLTAVRGQDGTSASAFVAGDACDLRVTAGVLSDALAEMQPLSTLLTNITASYTTAEANKLAAIEASATADQSGSEIKVAYESESDTNAYTDTEKSKLAGAASIGTVLALGQECNMADVLTGKGYAITTTDAAALTAAAGETITLIGLTIGNIHATTASWVTANVVRSGGVDSEIAHRVSIPVNDSLDLLQGKVVLNTGDALWFDAEANTSLEASISYLVQS